MNAFGFTYIYLSIPEPHKISILKYPSFSLNPPHCQAQKGISISSSPHLFPLTPNTPQIHNPSIISTPPLIFSIKLSPPIIFIHQFAAIRIFSFWQDFLKFLNYSKIQFIIIITIIIFYFIIIAIIMMNLQWVWFIILIQ